MGGGASSIEKWDCETLSEVVQVKLPGQTFLPKIIRKNRISGENLLSLSEHDVRRFAGSKTERYEFMQKHVTALQRNARKHALMYGSAEETSDQSTDEDDEITDRERRMREILLKRKPRPPEELFQVPYYLRNEFYSGRSDYMKLMRDRLKSCKCLALVGLGGIGKSSLAAMFADWQYFEKNKYKTGVYFLNGNSPASMHDGYKNLAIEQMRIPAARDEKNPEQIRKYVHAWMRKNKNWLLIIDNVDNEESFQLLQQGDYFEDEFCKRGHGTGVMGEYMPPPKSYGHVIITSRHDHAFFRSEKFKHGPIEVWHLPVSPACQFLYRRSCSAETPVPKEEIKRVLKTLEGSDPDEYSALYWLAGPDGLNGLPLAIEQAGAYLRLSQMTFVEYAKKIKAASVEFLSEGEEGVEARDIDRRKIQTTYDLNINRLNEKSLQLLIYMAYCDPDVFTDRFVLSCVPPPLDPLTTYEKKVVEEEKKAKIWLEKCTILGDKATIAMAEKQYRLKRLCVQDAKNKREAKERRKPVPRPWTILTEKERSHYDAIVAPLVECSLVHMGMLTCLPETSVLSMHRVLQIVVVDKYREFQKDILPPLISRLSMLFQFSSAQLIRLHEQQSQQILACLPNIESVIDHSSQINDVETTTIIANMLGQCAVVQNYTQGNYLSAMKLHKRALSMKKTLYKTNIVLTNQTQVVLKPEEVKAARVAAEKQNEVFIAMLHECPCHESVSNTLSAIGDCLFQKGDVDTALLFYWDALKMLQVVCNDSTEDIARAYSNLGSSLAATGYASSAINFFKTALDLYYDKFGPDVIHEDLSCTLANLAACFGSMGKPDESTDYLTKSYVMQIKLHGGKCAAHPQIAISLHNLGSAKLEQRNFTMAKHYLTESLGMKRIIYGAKSHHPSISLTLAVLGDLYFQLNEFENSKSYRLEAFEMNLAVHGEKLENGAQVELQEGLGDCCYRLRSYEESKHWLTASMEMNKRVKQLCQRCDLIGSPHGSPRSPSGSPRPTASTITFDSSIPDEDVARVMRKLVRCSLALKNSYYAIDACRYILSCENDLKTAGGIARYNGLPVHIDLAKTLKLLAEGFILSGNANAAIEFITHALMIEEKLFPVYINEYTIATDIVMGDLHFGKREFKTSSNYYHKALKDRTRCIQNHPHPTKRVTTISKTTRPNKPTTFKKKLRTLAVKEKHVDGISEINNPDEIEEKEGWKDEQVGNIFFKLGQVAYAEEYYDGCILYYESAMNHLTHPDDQELLLRRLFEVAKLQKKHEATLYYAEKIYTFCKNKAKQEHNVQDSSRDGTDVANAMVDVGDALMTLGRTNEAHLFYANALAMDQRLYAGQKHPDTVTKLDAIAKCLEEQGDMDTAFDRMFEAQLMDDALYSPISEYRPKGVLTMSSVLNLMSEFGDKESKYRASLALKTGNKRVMDVKGNNHLGFA